MAEGLSVPEAADRIGVCTKSIYDWCYRLGIKYTRQRMTYQQRIHLVDPTREARIIEHWERISAEWRALLHDAIERQIKPEDIGVEMTLDDLVRIEEAERRGLHLVEAS